MSSTTLFIRPANRNGEALKVRKPDSPLHFLNPEGEAVVPSRYWLRRIADGSVVKAAPLKAVKSDKPSKPNKENDQ